MVLLVLDIVLPPSMLLIRAYVVNIMVNKEASLQLLLRINAELYLVFGYCAPQLLRMNCTSISTIFNGNSFAPKLVDRQRRTTVDRVRT